MSADRFPGGARSLLALLALLGVAPFARADRLITKDGRILEVEKARLLADGSYELVFESGTILCPREFVASVEVEGDMSDYVPANEDEQKKLAAGYVKYRGKWMLKATYLVELEKQAEASRARTAELAAHAKFHDGWELETKHFRLQSNTSPEILAHYAELLEAYYDLMDQRVGIDPTPTLKKTQMRVCIYKSRAEFQEITKVEPGVAGFFRPTGGELHFYHDYQDPSVSEWIALHECTHLLTFLIEPQAQPWIWANEGVADFFGKATITRNKKGKLEIEPGQLQLERVLTVQQALADGTFLPLEKLFFLTKPDFHAFEYAHAWSFVYFLNNAKPEYEKAFKKFFKDFYTISKGVAFDLEQSGATQYGAWKIVPPAEVRRLLLEKLGRKDTLALEEEWKAFVAAIPIDAPRARFQRGLDALRQGDDPAATQSGLDDLEAAIAAGVEDPLAFFARGRLKLRSKGDEAAALADYREAIARAPLHGGFRTNLAQVLVGRALRAPGKPASAEAEAEARMQFDLACELEPENDSVHAARKTYLELLDKAGGTK